jgi:outer membrane protein TolC
LNDERTKQSSRRKAIEATIASIDTAITTTQQAVISPMTDFVAKMQRAYVAGTATVMSYLDAQRSLHESERRLISLRDQRDQGIRHLIEQGGMLPSQLIAATKQSNRK